MLGVDGFWMKTAKESDSVRSQMFEVACTVAFPAPAPHCTVQFGPPCGDVMFPASGGLTVQLNVSPGWMLVRPTL